jgi:hypothetical protein
MSGRPRPRYESQADRARELAVIERVGQITKLEPKSLPAYSEADYAMVRDGRVVGVAEVKVRGKRYDEMFISLHKVQALRDYAALGLAARIFFAVPDGIYAQEVSHPEINGWIGYAGRADRGDQQDQEMVVYYKTQGMRRLCASDEGWFA